MAELSDAEFLGAAPKQPSLVDRIKNYMTPTKAKPIQGELSDQAFLEMPEDPRATFGLYPKQPVQQTKLQAKPGELEYGPGKALGIAAGTVGQLVDMTLSGVEQFLTIPRRRAVYLEAQARGEKPEIALAASELAGDVLPAAVKTPFRLVAEALGPEAVKAYEENPLGVFATWLGESVERGSEKLGNKTGVAPETIKTAFHDAMGLLGGMAAKGTWNQLNKQEKAQFANDFLKRQRTKPLDAPAKPPAPSRASSGRCGGRA